MLQNFPDLLSAHLSKTAKHWNSFLSHCNSPMKIMAFVLTLIKGNDVQGWVESMGTVLNRLNPLVDNIPNI